LKTSSVYDSNELTTMPDYVVMYNRVQNFRDTLERATTYDSWGQVLEANDEYMRLVKSVTAAIAQNKGEPPVKGEKPKALEQVFNDQQVKFLSRMIRAVQKRAQSSLDLSGETGIKLMDIMQLLPMLDELPETVPPEFPIEVFGKGEDMDAVLGSMTAQAQIGGGNSGGGGGVDAASARSVGGGGGGGRGRGRAAPDEYGSDDEDGGPTNAAMGGLSGQEKEASAGGTLLARKRFPTHTGISILIDKIRLKDADQYFEPTVTVTIHDKDGRVIAGGESQISGYPQNTNNQQLEFNQEVHLQIPFEVIPTDAAIFFEFKHYKPSRNKISTKCFSFLEHDELERPGNLPMELYQKPTDTRRRKLTLLTDKAFYLHVTITRHTPGN